MAKKIIRILLVLAGILVIVLCISYLINGGEHKITNNVKINRPQSEVFEIIADMRNELKWNPDVQFMEKKTEGATAIGTKFKAKWHLSDTLEVTITRFDEPGKLTFVNGGPIEVTLNVSLNSLDTSLTEMQTEFIAKPHGFARAIFPVIKVQMEKQEKLNMINLKNYIENKR